MGNGGSESKSTLVQEQDTFVVNKSNIDILNKMVNTTAVNTIISNAKNCSAAILNSQNIRLKNLKFGDNATIDIYQKQTAFLDFSCVQKDEVKNDIITKMTETIQQQLDKNVDQKVLSKLAADVAAKSQQDFGAYPWGGSSSDANVNQKVKTHTENIQSTNLKNVIENSVYANFTNSNYSECITKIVNDQGVTIEDVTAGTNFNLRVGQEQAAESLTKCMQNSEISNRAISDIVKFAGVKIKETTTQTATTETEGKAEAEARSTGIGQAIGDIIKAPFEGIGNMFKNMFGDAGPIVSICCSCIIMIIALVGGYMFLKSQGMM